ncbi:MAG: hypothetical protein AB7N76_17665 [Planctomycetota bacterium]
MRLTPFLAPAALVMAALALAPSPVRADDDPGPAARRQNEQQAIGVLKAISSAQSLFREGDKDQNNELDYAGSLQALVDTDLVSRDLKGGERGGYVFVVKRSVKTPEFVWAATAVPKQRGKTGDRYFAISQDGVVYQALEPIALGADCTLPQGLVPVGKALPGFDPLQGMSPLERALAAAAEARIRVTDLILRSPDGAVFYGFEVAGGSSGWRVQALRVTPKDKRARVEQARLEPSGGLDGLGIATGEIGARRALSEEHGALGPDGKTIVLKPRGEGEPRQGVYAPGMLPRALVLFVLPTLAQEGKLKLPLRLPLLEDAFAAKQPTFALEALDPAPEREGAGPGERAYSLSDGARRAVVWFDAKGPVALRDLDGQLAVRCSEEVFEREVLGKQAGQLGEARRYGNEAAAIGALKTISTAQLLFREGDKDQNGVLDYADGLEALGKCRLIDSVLASGEKNGYRFAVACASKAPEFQWMAVASPLDPKQGGRHFAVNQAGVIYYSDKPFELDGVECQIKGGTPVGK